MEFDKVDLTINGETVTIRQGDRFTVTQKIEFQHERSYEAGTSITVKNITDDLGLEYCDYIFEFIADNERNDIKRLDDTQMKRHLEKDHLERLHWNL